MGDTTTLQVPKEFAEDLRDNYEGRNDIERLHEWAEEYESDLYDSMDEERGMDEERVREIVREEIEHEKRGY